MIGDKQGGRGHLGVAGENTSTNMTLEQRFQENIARRKPQSQFPAKSLMALLKVVKNFSSSRSLLMMICKIVSQGSVYILFMQQ